MEHVRKDCMVEGCEDEASYWIENAGFVETLLADKLPDTFYLCVNHQYELMNQETGLYHHLRIDTGEILKFEIGGYACHLECEVCNE
jgi:hypothetical protein